LAIKNIETLMRPIQTKGYIPRVSLIKSFIIGMIGPGIRETNRAALQKKGINFPGKS